MRVGLLFLAGLAASAMCSLNVAADTVATIVYTSYPNNDCTGTATILSGDAIVTGTCTASDSHDLNRQWKTQHCNNDGSQIYTVYYTDSECSDAVSVTQTPTACTKLNNRRRPTCQNAALGPANPTGDFPPSSKWQVTTSYMNQVTRATDVCVVGGDVIVTSTTSSKLNNCITRQAENGGSSASSSASYCSSDLGMSGDVTFSSTNCKSGTAQSANLNKNSCNNGDVTVCPSGSKFPKLPTAGVVNYKSKDNCTNAFEVQSYDTLAVDSCYDSTKYQCANVDGKPQIIKFQYSDPAKIGQCVKYVSNDTLTDLDVCTDSGAKYSCAMEQLGSAASASASMVAVAFAAIVSLLAARQ